MGKTHEHWLEEALRERDSEIIALKRELRERDQHSVREGEVNQMWKDVGTTDSSIYDLEQATVGPYLLAVWKLREWAMPKQRESDPVYYSVTCDGRCVVSAKSRTGDPKREATKAAAVHCCELMQELQRNL